MIQGKGKKQQAGYNPLLKEGPARRSKIVMLPQVIGAAGVVSHAISYSFKLSLFRRRDTGKTINFRGAAIDPQYSSHRRYS